MPASSPYFEVIVSELFADGGVLVKNPSLYGGTWAWVLVEDKKIVRSGSGLIYPQDYVLKAISNNFTELLACVEGLEAMAKDWRGTLWTDSLVTVKRLRNGFSESHTVPQDLINRTRNALVRLKWSDIWMTPTKEKKIRIMHLMGHPTKVELKSGRSKGGLPVSKWNVLVDKTCGQLARVYLRERGLRDGYAQE